MILQLLCLMVVVRNVLSQHVRLVNGDHFNQGWVEVQINGVWGTVCAHGWDNNDARVVCRQLGFPHENALAIGGVVFGEGKHILLDYVDCNGAEKNLAECRYHLVGVRDLDYDQSDNAGVICTNVSLQVRLVNGGHPHQGRVEVQFNGFWGTVCDNSWNYLTARVVCRQLGLDYESALPVWSATFGEGTGQILLGNVFCSGEESNLDECSHRAVGVHSCGHHKDAGVICTNDVHFSQIRLVSGNHPHQGRVEVQFNGQLGTVCDKWWDNREAEVLCRQLGFEHGNAFLTGSTVFGDGAGLILPPYFLCNGAESNLSECSYVFGGRCEQTDDVGVICTNDILEVRLVNGSHPHQGRVEVQVNGVWGTVCDNSYSYAKVVCRQLGFDHENAFATGSGVFGEGTGPMFLADVDCHGAENYLNECNLLAIARIANSCQHTRDAAGIVCTNDILEVRLVNGSHPHEGRVEVQVNGVWGTVCDNSWSVIQARVVCRQLGFEHGNALATRSDVFGEGTGPIFLGYVHCNGPENYLNECKLPPNSAKSCQHSRDAGVVCTNDILQVRLVNGSHPHQGRVEVQFNGVWGTVCDTLFGDLFAKVVCRQLGFPHKQAVGTKSGIFGGGTGPMFLDQVTCYGREIFLSECKLPAITSSINSCQHTKAVGVVCTNDTLSFKIRLVNGQHSHRGRVEVQFNGVWGTVCDTRWDNNGARVVCRQLGFPHENAVATRSAAFGEGTGQILLNVHCNGAENNLGECSHGSVGVHNCGHSEDAGVICTNDKFFSQIRLINGSHPHQGRVEVQINGEWGTVCDTDWDYREARVTCRQLGFEHGNVIATRGAIVFGEGAGLIFPPSISCNGAESSLSACSYRVYGSCGHTNNAGVICTNDSLRVRLVNGSHRHQGRVEVQVNDEWGTVCGVWWSNRDARVVCRQLGFGYGNAIATGSALFGEGTGPIMLAYADCNGAENYLSECNLPAIPSSVNPCEHTGDAGVICTNVLTIRGLRLANGSHHHQGRVEIQVDGIWGTVCHDNWDNNDARVVCRQLGFDPENATATRNAEFGEGTGPIFLDEVDCNGTENTLGGCSYLFLRDRYCAHGEDAGVICTDDEDALTTAQLPVTEMTSDKGTGTVSTASGTYNIKLNNLIKLTLRKD